MKTKSERKNVPEPRVEPFYVTNARSFAEMFLSFVRRYRSPSQQARLVEFIMDRDGFNLAYGRPLVSPDRFDDLAISLLRRLDGLDPDPDPAELAAVAKSRACRSGERRWRVNKSLPLPKLFATVADAEVILGMSRTAIYAKLIRRHPELLIQFDGRSLIDLEPAAVIVREMARGPRRPNGGGKGRKRRP
jgi:hypothetical protein